MRPGEELDWDALAAHLRRNLDSLDGVALDGDMEVLQFPNGSANLTYLVAFGDQHLVVRRPPFGRLAPSAHDMRREHRVLSQLARLRPGAFLFCDDHGVIGSDFLVIEYRSGEVIWGAVPPAMRHHPDVGGASAGRWSALAGAPAATRRRRTGRARPAAGLLGAPGGGLGQALGAGRPGGPSRS